MEHLDWIAKEPSVGLAIWDAQLKDPKWRTKEIWKTISNIKNGADLNGTGTPTISVEKNEEVK
jgi:hypothetical protein